MGSYETSRLILQTIMKLNLRFHLVVRPGNVQTVDYQSNPVSIINHRRSAKNARYKYCPAASQPGNNCLETRGSDALT